MTIHCVWCQNELEFLFDGTAFRSSFQEEAGSQWDVPEDAGPPHICPNCLISMLPKTLALPLESSERAAALLISTKELRQTQRFPLISQISLSSSQLNTLVIRALILEMSNSGMKICIRGEGLIKRKDTITLGVLGDYLIYKAIGKVVHVKSTRGELPFSVRDDAAVRQASSSPAGQDPYIELGIRLTGIHQDLRE